MTFRDMLRIKLGREPTEDDILRYADRQPDFEKEFGCQARSEMGVGTKLLIGAVALGSAVGLSAWAWWPKKDKKDKDKKESKEATTVTPGPVETPKTPPQLPPGPPGHAAPPAARQAVQVPAAPPPSAAKSPLAGLLSIADSAIDKIKSLAEPPVVSAPPISLSAAEDATFPALKTGVQTLPGGSTDPNAPQAPAPDHVFLFPEAPPTGGPAPYVAGPGGAHPVTSGGHHAQAPAIKHDAASPLAALLGPIVQEAKHISKSPTTPILNLLGSLSDIGISGVTQDDPEVGGA